MQTKQIFIFDLDGTLANIQHRRHLVENGNHEWDEFYERCVDDTPNEAVIQVYKILQSEGYFMYIFSGRSEAVRLQTQEWFKSNGLRYTRLMMRPDKDYTPDDQLKRKWLNENIDRTKIVAVFDDRDKVVKMWREEGIACFQVADGAF